MPDRARHGDAIHFPLTRNHVGVAQVVERIEGMLTAAGCVATEAQLFAAAVEEVLVNVANHAWPADEEHGFDAWLDLSTGAGTLRAWLRVEDDGIAFDPTQQAPVPNVDAELDDRAIGGLGVHMVRQLTDEQRYARIDGLNVMEIVKTFRLEGAEQP